MSIELKCPKCQGVFSSEKVGEAFEGVWPKCLFDDVLGKEGALPFLSTQKAGSLPLPSF